MGPASRVGSGKALTTGHFLNEYDDPYGEKDFEDDVIVGAKFNEGGGVVANSRPRNGISDGNLINAAADRVVSASQQALGVLKPAASLQSFADKGASLWVPFSSGNGLIGGKCDGDDLLSTGSAWKAPSIVDARDLEEDDDMLL